MGHSFVTRRTALSRDAHEDRVVSSAETPTTTPAPKIPPCVRGYVRLVALALSDGQRITQRAAAQRLGVSEFTLSRALHRPGVQGWCAGELDALLNPTWLTAQIQQKVAHQAITGRIEQQRLWFEVQGAIKQPAGQQAGPGGAPGVAPPNLTPIVIRIEGDAAVTVHDPHHGNGTANGNGHAAIPRGHQEDGRG